MFNIITIIIITRDINIVNIIIKNKLFLITQRKIQALIKEVHFTHDVNYISFYTSFIKYMMITWLLSIMHAVFHAVLH